MDRKVSNVSEGGGNTQTPPSKNHRSRAWCFTVNNYDDAIVASVVSFVSKSLKYIYGFEVGQEGTHHIQGYVLFKNQKRFTTCKNAIPTAHWERAKGTPDDNWKYCSKDGDYKSNYEPKLTREDIRQLALQAYDNVQWLPWQEEVLRIAAECKSTRTIHWFYEQTGNVGKTFIAKYLCLTQETIICQGKSADIFQQVNCFIDAGRLPKLIIVDVPRVTLDYVSYNSIECLKNGMLYSGKYEGGQCIFPPPTVICFANELPQIRKLSIDRWNIKKITGNILEDYNQF